ncbi:MAG: hypothetical protein WBA41_29105 [Rivularia sp. (in: cyanobacteria)]
MNSIALNIPKLDAEGFKQLCLESPATVSGEDVLPGFELNLNKIW